MLGRGFSGNAEVVEAAGVLLLEDVRLAPGHLDVTARWLGRAPASFELWMASGRATLAAEPTAWNGADGELRLQIPLTWDEWGMGAAPVPVDRYSFGLTHGAKKAEGRVMYDVGMLGHTLDFQLDGDYLMRPFRGRGEVGVVLARPLGDDERGPYHQKQLQRWLASGEARSTRTRSTSSPTPGASATDTQLAIHHELRRPHPHLTLYWGVADRSATVPEGADPGAAQQPRVVPRAGGARRTSSTTSTSTAGSPSGRGSGCCRPSTATRRSRWASGCGAPRSSRRGGSTPSWPARPRGWDLILTPAPEMDEHYRTRVRATTAPILSHGYPRDDVLVVAGRRAGSASETRERLGIRPEQTAVLYAPTWRDDLATNYRSARRWCEHLDVESASRALGDDFVMLMRGHRFHARARRTASGGRRG